jgi:branched-subunit amino acid aminotransferase/4-amino-4-deoxychorismate lyase
LRGAAAVLGAPVPELKLFEGLPELVAAAGVVTQRLRLVLGPDDRVVVAVTPVRAAGGEPVSLAQVAARRDPDDPTCALKTTSRAFWQLAQREAEAAGADEALVCARAADGGDKVAECAWSNLFLATADGELRTPRADGCFLPGVARAALLDAAHAAGEPVQETRVRPADLRRPGVALAVTNAVHGARPARLVDREPHPTPAATRAVERLRQWWQGLLEPPV